MVGPSAGLNFRGSSRPPRGVVAFLGSSLFALRFGFIGLLIATTATAGSDGLRPLPANRGSGQGAQARPGGRDAVGSAAGTAQTGAKIGTRSERSREEAESRPSRQGGDAATGAAANVARSAGDGTYRLGPQDRFQIQIWNRAEIEHDWRPVTVTGDGAVFVPLLGDVAVDGLTVTEVVRKLTGLYDAFIIGPQVYIEMMEYNSRQVTVIGEVNAPGRYALKGAVSLTEMIAEAGGVNKDAAAIVRLIREREGQAVPDVFDINIAKINEGDARENVEILPDDTIIVLTNKNIVYVSGMVKTEGFVDWEEGMTAVEAVILAGGLAEGHAGGHAKVYRTDGNTTVEHRVNLKKQTERFLLQPGDIIKVPKSWL